MKRILSVLVALCFLMPFISAADPRQELALTEKQKKILMKKQGNDARAFVKAIRKAGFELVDSGMLDAKVLRHIARRDALGSDGVEFMGPGRSKSNNLGRQMAKFSVVTDYMTRAAAELHGRILYHTPIINDSISRTLEKCWAAYEQAMERRIPEFLHESYSIRKPVEGDRYEFRTMFLVDEKEACKARREAIAEAIEVSGVDPEYIDYLTYRASEPILNRYESPTQFMSLLKR